MGAALQADGENEVLLSATLKEKGISFRSSIVPDGLPILADPELLEQAVINLIRNAMDAVANEPSPSIEISCQRQEGQTVIAISDNGRGLSPDEMNQIFIPFFTTKPGGSGIGLSLARQIALPMAVRSKSVRTFPRGRFSYSRCRGVFPTEEFNGIRIQATRYAADKYPIGIR